MSVEETKLVEVVAIDIMIPHLCFTYVYGPLTERQREILRENYRPTPYSSMRVRVLLGIWFYDKKFSSPHEQAEWDRQRDEALLHAIPKSQIVQTEDECGFFPPENPVLLIEVL